MTRTRLSAVVGALLIISAVLVAATVPATSHSGTRYGAKLDGNTQPSNSLPKHGCDSDPGAPCTWVMLDALKRPGNRLHWSKAPRDGVIKKIRLIAGGPGKFRLQIAKVKPGSQRAKIVRNGPRITYKGQPPAWPEPYTIETFKVNVPVKKGQFLAIRANRTSMLRCNSGGAKILQFQAPLKVGGNFRTATDTDGCNLLLEAILK